MDKLEDLINKLCPNGVKYKSLNEVCSVMTGKQLNKDKLLDDAEYPVINGGINPSGYWHEFNTDKNTITISQGGASAGYVNYMEEPFWAGAHCYVVKLEDSNVNYRYLYHYVKSIEKKLQQCQQGAGIPSVSRKTIYDNLIPVPPLEVQQKIVHILDDFESLISELSTELKAREKQFTYFEEKLLFNCEFEKVKLGDLCVVNQGLQIPISQRKMEPGENRYFYITVQFLKGGEENYYIENPQQSVICNKDDILVTRTGSTGKIITGVEGCFHNNFFKVEPNEKILKRYLYFVLNSRRMYNKMLSVASGGTVPDLPHKKFYNLEIFLPSIDEQTKAITVLEKLYELSYDTSKGLPAEIEKRQKQYEYYRDKLLSFKEVEVNE